MSIIVTKAEQLVITVTHQYEHRPNHKWHGCLEIERGDYSYADIMKLANDDPDTIDRVLVIKGSELRDVTDEVIAWEENRDE